VDNPKIQAEGRLERAGGTRYPYGSHALVPPGDRIVRFILRSDTVELRDLEGQHVRVTGSLVEGHPPNEGDDPKLLDVFAITPLQQE
jgi:hypothetical protein